MKRKILIPLAAVSVLIGTGIASAQMFGGGRGQPGFGRSGGDVTVQIYTADPATGAQPIETLTLERALSPGEIIANYEGATFVIVSGADFSRTIDLAALAVEVQIYAEDPDTGAAPIVEVTLSDGSELRSLVTDTEGAAFVVIRGDDFTRTIDLSEGSGAVIRFGPEGDFAPGFRERGGPGNDRFQRPGHVGPRGN